MKTQHELANALDDDGNVISRREHATNNGRDTSVASFDPRAKVRMLKGRSGGPAQAYLDVKHRIVWARSEHSDLQIITEAISVDDKFAFFKATVSYYTIDDGDVLRTLVACTAHGSETAGDFRDYVEKAETKAVGRALHHLGYGTESMPDDDVLADAPVEQREAPQSDAAAEKAASATTVSPELAAARQSLSSRARWIGANSRRMGAIVMAALDLTEPVTANDLTVEQIRRVLDVTDDTPKDYYATDEQPARA